MLFADDYLRYKFPEPQYLGAKFILLDWIRQFIPPDCKVVLDAFAGTQSVAFLMKQLGFKVLTNDFLQFNHQIGLAFIENKKVKLESQDLEILFSSNQNSNEDFSLIRQTFTDIFFIEEQSAFLDNFRANINLLENPFKKALAFAVMNRSISRKILMGHYEIVEKMKDRDDNFCREALQSIKNIRLEILNQAIQNPRELIQNLYEQQGELRFDASNRLFLILVDTENFDNSWKLKRSLDLLKPNIKNYLDNFTEKNIEELKVIFNYKGKEQTFTALSDTLFILK